MSVALSKINTEKKIGHSSIFVCDFYIRESIRDVQIFRSLQFKNWYRELKLTIEFNRFFFCVCANEKSHFQKLHITIEFIFYLVRVCKLL